MANRKLVELNRCKIIIRNTINKDTDLTIDDFEKFVKLKYRVEKFYDSINQFYAEKYNMDIGNDFTQYVDDFALHIVNTRHKVFSVRNKNIKDRSRNSTVVYYSYDGKKIMDVFIQSPYVVPDFKCLWVFTD